MKKILMAVAVAATALFCAEAFAQPYNSTRFGVIGGVTSSQNSIKNVDTKSISLYSLGVALETPVGAGFGFQTGVVYQVKGMSMDKAFNSTPAEIGESFETKVGYLEVPFQFQWGPDLLAFRPYGFLEPFVGYRLTESTKGDIAKDLSRELSKVEYGLSIGAGLDIWKFQFSAKYFWNFGRIYESGEFGDSAVQTWKDAINNGNNFNGFSASVAIFF